MKARIPAAALCLAIFSAPAVAQDAPKETTPPAGQTGDGQVEKGFGLLQEGTRLMLKGLLDQMEPALRDLGTAIDDLNAYEVPEVLPNGDILIRRKHPKLPEATPKAPGETPKPDQTDI